MTALLERMRIATRSKKRKEHTQNTYNFYIRHATIVFNTLRSPLFRSFLTWMLRRERIKEHQIKSVQIRMFPMENGHGTGLAGKCNSKGEIRLYPKRLEFYRRKLQKLSKETLSFYIKCRARATLIHELLHLKYARDEEKVRELTEKYFIMFTDHKSLRNPDLSTITKMLFT